jgi:hypothetical protein
LILRLQRLQRFNRSVAINRFDRLHRSVAFNRFHRLNPLFDFILEMVLTFPFPFRYNPGIEAGWFRGSRGLDPVHAEAQGLGGFRWYEPRTVLASLIVALLNRHLFTGGFP